MRVSFLVASSTAQTKRTPLRATVRNQPLLIATVADRFARGVDTAVKSRVRHDPAAPNRSDKVVLANHAITVLDEIQQQVEHLRLKRDEPRVPPKLPTIRIEYLVFKAKLHVRPRGRFHGMLKFIGKTIQVGVGGAGCRPCPLWVKSGHVRAKRHIRFTPESRHRWDHPNQLYSEMAAKFYLPAVRTLSSFRLASPLS